MKTSNNKRKAIALLSGGLDSRLAVKMILDQGIEVEAVNFVTVFCTCTARSSCKSEARKAAEEYGIGLKTLNTTRELLDAVRNARHGYGRGVNPCLDCRISMFRKAGEYMREAGAGFIVTGEVWGERPMSQRPDAMRLIEKESGLEGLIVRPLSAHLFEPSIPERKGWVNREKLMAMEGRSRKPQMQLAAEIGVNDYPCPAGGCLLCEKDFAVRLRTLLEENPDPPIAEIQSLRLGRIFFAGNGNRIIIPRNEEETRRLTALAQPGDVLMSAGGGIMGPTSVIKGKPVGEAALLEAAALTARYGQGREAEKVTVEYYPAPGDSENARPDDCGILEILPADGWRLAEELERQ
ncbi:MAG: hypothetical protein IBX61_06325 [Thermoleophilia bacterium]|nr:hypothetical protein [Thermoleophilia bacterium]